MNKYFMANAALSMFSKNYMGLKKGLPIRPSEMGVLNIITQTQGPHTPVLLAGLLNVSKPMITAHLAALSEKGYIKKERSPEDKRVFFVLPTEKGSALVKDAKADLDRQLGQLEQEMGPDEFNDLVELVRKANEIMQKEGFCNGSER